MFFKQLQLYQLETVPRIAKEEWINLLKEYAFHPCLPSHPYSIGWSSPIDEEESALVHMVNGYIVLCLQIEEKVLPGAVIRQELQKKIKEIELAENRKIYQKEKLRLKDEVTTSLLLRAFTKITRVFAYIDTKNNWLVLGTTNAKKAEQFITLFKKSINENITPLQFKQLATVFTHWLKNQEYPRNFAIEKACVLQDPNQQNRIIRCQEQNLFANSIQSLIKEGCVVKQIALSWQDRINLVLAENFLISGLKFSDVIKEHETDMEADSKLMKFNAEIIIFTETISALLNELLAIFNKNAELPKALVTA